MKKIVAIIILLCAAVASLGALLPTQPPVCTATPPAQAVTLGYTKLVYCNALTSTVGVVDLNNTLNPWFLFYMTAFGVTIPAANVTANSMGLTISSVPSDDYGGLSSTANGASSYAGNTITGSFYVEGDALFDDTICKSSPNSWPALWLDYSPGLIGNGTTNEFTEIDIFEWMGCANFMTVHDWTGGTQNCQNTGNQVPLTPGTGWNTWGVSLKTSIDGGGTGTIQWYFNNTLELTQTYSPSGKPNPAGSCPVGAFATADTQPFTILMNAGTSDPVTFRNIHVWQKP